MHEKWRIADQIVAHLLALIGAIVTVAALISILTSKSIRAWIHVHSSWLFAIWLLTILAAFVVIDYMRNRNQSEPTRHDKGIVEKIFGCLPADGETIGWLRHEYIAKLVPVKHLDVIDEVLTPMHQNVLGMDNRKANDAYCKLRDAMERFRMHISLNMFMDDAYERMHLSGNWSQEERDETMTTIVANQEALVTAYDNFLIICHRYRLD
jgi:general stress protein CsbA